jgi:hypothetical protein
MRLAGVTRTFRDFANMPFSILRPLNICIWHIGRCGSTVVGDLLDQDSRIVWGSEILETYSKKVEARNLQHAAWKGAKRRIRYKQLTAGSKIFGCEMKVWHLRRIGVEPKTVLNFLKQQNFDKHIILERKNYLRAEVSGHVGLAISKMHLKIGEPPISAKIHLPMKDVYEHMRLFEHFIDEMKSLLPDSCLKITYEDDILPDPLIAYRKIVNYIGLRPRKVAIKYQRTNPKKLKEIVLNLEEVTKSLKGTKYEWMLTAE